MANKKPFFLTGANAKILLNNRTVAYATDISYRVSVKHASPRVLGRFEVEAHQPLAYDVEGSLTIIKYARGLKSHLDNNASPVGVSDKGSGMGSYGTQGLNWGTLGLPSADGQFDGAADESFVPGRMFQSKMFDIEIRQKVPGGKQGGTNTLLGAARMFFRGVDDVLVRDMTTPGNDETTMVLLRDCRFVDMGFTMTKKGVALQTLTFKARYADDDTAIARKSGVGQEFS